LALPGLALTAPAVRAAVAKKPLPPVDLSFVASRMDLVRRSEWTDASPCVWRLRGTEEYDRLTVHHGGSLNVHTDRHAVVHDLEGVLTAHRERNFGDIGYHFIIDHGGRIWEGRSLSYEGAHVSGQNRRNIGVMLLGNFESQRPSEKQQAALGQLVMVLRGRYGIKRHRVYGHRDLGHSVCPGRHLYRRVVAMRSG